MPIVVDPGFVWPPEVDPVVSPDGRLTAIVDPAHAGVLLRADFDDSVPDTPAVPEKVLRRNLCKNPSFEAGTAGWNVGNRVTLSQVAIDGTITSGTKSAEVRFPTGGTNATTSMRIYRDMGEAVTPGQWVAMSAFVRRGVNAQAGLESQLYAEWTTAAGVFVGRPMSTAKKLTTDTMAYSPGSPCLQTYVVQVPSGVGLLTSPGIRFQADGDMAKVLSTDYGYVDAVQLFIADTKAQAEAAVTSYFDGSTPQSGGKRYRWTGTANASESEEYTPATPFVPGHGATTAKVRFERQDGTVVRSGNPAWAPGGYAHAYDHEATLGGGTLWRAVPIRFDGTEGEPSEYVGAVIPPLSDGWAWLKPVADPDKAMLLKVEPPDLSYDGRVDTTSIAGAPRPAATWDVLEGFTTQLRSLVREKNVEEQLKALLDEGPVLAQFPACAGLPDFYFIRGKLDLEHVHWDGWPWRRYQWDVVQIDRPDTTDSPLRIPGLSYDTVARDWTTYDQLKSTVESYNKLLEP